MDSACEELPSSSKQASVFILYVNVTNYLITQMIVSLLFWTVEFSFLS